MIYYPLSTLMLAGIRDILVITTPHEQAAVPAPAGRRLAVGHAHPLRGAAASPNGLAEAFMIGASSSAAQPACLILGDNIFYGHGLTEVLQRAAAARVDGATVFGYWVRDPERYGVAEFDADGRRGRHRGEAAAPEVELRRDRALLLRRAAPAISPPR